MYRKVDDQGCSSSGQTFVTKTLMIDDHLLILKYPHESILAVTTSIYGNSILMDHLHNMESVLESFLSHHKGVEHLVGLRGERISLKLQNRLLINNNNLLSNNTLITST